MPSGMINATQLPPLQQKGFEDDEQASRRGIMRQVDEMEEDMNGDYGVSSSILFVSLPSMNEFR